MDVMSYKKKWGVIICLRKIHHFIIFVEYLNQNQRSSNIKKSLMREQYIKLNKKTQM